jgi:lipopolysaccharide heptosyltransferase I
MDVPHTHPQLRVLITRLSHVGDCIATLPLACALRDRFPNAFISWVVEQPSDQLLATHAAIDELVVLRRGWLKRPRELVRLRRRLRELNCNLVLDPQSLSKSAIAAWLAGAALRIGLGRPSGREIAPWLNNHLVAPGQRHIVDRSLELLRPLGIHNPPVRFALTLDPAACEWTRQFINDSHLGCGFVVIHPGAGWRSKRWPPRRFGVVARHMGQRHQVPSVVTWAGADELAWAQEIVAGSGGHALLAPRTDLTQLAALLELSRFFLGCDTGPMHLAAAVGRPCVALYGPTLPEETGAYGPAHLAVCAPLRPRSHGARRRGDNEAMRSIETRCVIEACEAMLHRGQDNATNGSAPSSLSPRLRGQGQGEGDGDCRIELQTANCKVHTK